MSAEAPGFHRYATSSRRCWHRYHPPNACGCWIAIDPEGAGGVEKEINGWHRQPASIFPVNTFPRKFEIVNVRRLDAKAYSVLGCQVVDLTALKPL
jgi:hypothetical protein